MGVLLVVNFKKNAVVNFKKICLQNSCEYAYNGDKKRDYRFCNGGQSFYNG